jgi:ribosomal protein L1
MAFFIGREREARRAYGFDEIALVPGGLTINPAEVDISTKIGKGTLKIPFIASAMDGVVDVKFAVTMGKLGGLAVLNLDGVQTRYEDPTEILAEISQADPETATELVQKMYREPIKEKLVGKRVEQMKKAGIAPAVSCIPQNAEKFGAAAKEAGADFIYGEEDIKKIKDTGKIEFDVAVSTLEMMPKLAPAAKVLGPKGLMPSPKTETVGPDIKKIISEMKKGKATFKNDDGANVHQVIGKVSFEEAALKSNFIAFVDALRKAKPASAKGTFIKSLYLTSSMGPSIKVSIE